ncbi:hypothetical protein AKO1_000518 [Acrasis kona]|uniref:Biotin-protein ligase N-terminal domain-containing protein n=1 Tax=Acrasis kona TaxID=1008807 RepID=A0AAW2ZQQ7_9EUKA
MSLQDLLAKRSASMRNKATSFVNKNPEAKKIGYFVYEKDPNHVKFMKLCEYLKEEFSIIQVTGEEICSGILESDGFDCLIIPGGYHVEHYKHMGGEEGGAAVRRAVNSGVGYIGICAGAYSACSVLPDEPIHSFCPTWNLLPQCKLKERQEPEYLWKRGMGECNIRLNKMGIDHLGHVSSDVKMFYRNGPCLEVLECECETSNECKAECHVLGLFDCDFDNENVKPGVLKNSASIVVGEHGQGKIFVYSAHPEASDPDVVVPMLIKSIRYVCTKNKLN